MAKLKLGVNLRTITITSNYTASVYDDIINVDASLGNVAVTLPDATLCPGKSIVVTKVDSTFNFVTVSGAQPINGASSVVLFQQNEAIDFASTSLVWISIGLGSRSAQSSTTSLRNYAINGDLMIRQRFPANTGATFTGGVQYYFDRIGHSCQGSTSKSLTVIADTDVPTFSQCGYHATQSISMINNTGFSTSDVNDNVQAFYTVIEGFDYAGLHGNIITFGFWFWTSVPGVYAISLIGHLGQSYVTNFTMPVANTWTFIQKTVQLESSGAYGFNNGNDLAILVGSIAGSAQVTSTLNQWQAGYFVADPSSANTWNAITGATMKFWGLQIVKGTSLNPKIFSPHASSFAESLRSCQRYAFSPTYNYSVTGGTGTFLTGAVATTTTITIGTFPVIMRAQPTMNFGNLVVIPAAGAAQNITGFGADTRLTPAGYFIALVNNNTGISTPIPCAIGAQNAGAFIIFDAEL